MHASDIDTMAGQAALPDEIWTPPAPSVAGRLPAMGQKDSSVKAVLVGGNSPCHVYAESSIEERVAVVLLTRPDVVRLEEQLKPVSYVDIHGENRQHWFDFRATFDDGHRIAIAVKPARKAIAMRLKEELDHLALQLHRSFADGVRLMTELDVPRDVVHDARLLHAVRRDPPCEADDAVRDLVASLAGTISVGDIVRHTGLGATAFRAVARQIGSGDIRVVGAPRIDYATRVARGHGLDRRAA